MDLPNPVLAKVTERVIARSQKLVLHIYNVLNMPKANSQLVVHSHANLAHGFAGMEDNEN